MYHYYFPAKFGLGGVVSGLQSRDFLIVLPNCMIYMIPTKKNVSGKPNFVFAEEESLKGHIFSEA